MRLLVPLIASFAFPLPVFATPGGFDIVLVANDYDYREKADGFTVVRDEGAMVGFGFGYTETLAQGFFVRAEAVGRTGEIDYRDDAGDSIGDVNQSVADIRLLVGKDFAVGKNLLTLSTGYGVRALFDESGGRQTASGLQGYDRTVTYRYIPAQAGLAMPIGRRTALEVSGEYRIFLDGDSGNDFSELGEGAVDLTFDQDDGEGWAFAARAVLPLGRRELAVGPFYERWRVDASDEYVFSDPEFGDVVLYEPENRTERIGISAALRF